MFQQFTGIFGIDLKNDEEKENDIKEIEEMKVQIQAESNILIQNQNDKMNKQITRL